MESIFFNKAWLQDLTNYVKDISDFLDEK